ncbi:LPXTG cell wall anchor domain-containing protein [Candidatus Woesebacteria bacterium]|nr:LPXTG cell wall anchor domain-containing protein [Candidatus Woesebacteria bacterium]
MRKVLLISLLVLALNLGLTSGASAQDQTCTQAYGGGVVCGAANPPIEHKPVKTGLADNLALAGGLILLASGVFFYFSKRVNNSIAG